MSAMALDPADAAHLLRRTGFGVPPALLDELTALPDREAAIARVTDVSRSPSIADCPVSTAKQTNELAALNSLTLWWLERMRTSPVPLVEKLTLFWHDHFVVSAGKVPDLGLLSAQHRLFRTYGTGDFHTLVQQVAVDPAMLLYLDNWANAWWAPQENFGRELMELFTLGTGQYEQSDVVAMTRAWTGYTLDPAAGYRTFKLNPSYHDSSSSTLFGKRKAWDGPTALTEVVKGARAERCSRFIAAKVFSLLVRQADPDDEVIGPIAEAFRAADLDILELVRTILRSDAFWSPESRHQVVRSPIEWVVAAMQGVDMATAEGVPLSWLDRMGQRPFLHPDVNGWVRGEAWLTTATAWGKQAWAAAMRYPLYAKGFLSEVAYMSADDAIATVTAKLGVSDLSPATRGAMERLWAASRSGGYAITLGVNLTLLVLLSPEFQVI
jgi:uncharacterized protein (DUF1800 family)